MLHRAAPWLLLSSLILGCQQDRAAPAADSAKTPSVTVATPARSAAEQAPAWPALPTGAQQLEVLLAEYGRRPPAEQQRLDAELVRGALRRAIRDGRAAAGWRAIVAALDERVEAAHGKGRRSLLLFGTYHDAPGQVDAFRLLVGPLGLRRPPLAAVEVLQGDGHWRGFAVDAQRGDDARVAAYLGSGDEQAFADLYGLQRQYNYTAWKYGYAEQVMDLLVTARASGRPLIGCDMPRALLARVRSLLGGDGEPLRDLHCALRLRHRTDSSVALLWGSAHLAPSRLPRFLPESAQLTMIHLLGRRVSGGALESALNLRITEPILLPVSDDRLVLLLDGPLLGAKVDRVRQIRPNPDGEVTVRGAGGQLHLGSQRVTLGGREQRVKLERPAGAFVLEREGEPLVAGQLPIGVTSVDFEPDGTVRIVTSR